MPTLSDVQQALINAQVMQEHWIDGGWEALSIQLEEELNKKKQVIDVYPLVEADINVYITIVLLDKIYKVPLEDVSAIPVNDCLVISKEHLYPDWEERIKTKIDSSFIEKTRVSSDELFLTTICLGSDDKVRILKERVV